MRWLHKRPFLRRRGISYLVYSKFAYGKKEKSSLSEFKERNAFERVDITRYYDR